MLIQLQAGAYIPGWLLAPERGGLLNLESILLDQK
jgi:hypothetical protein